MAPLNDKTITNLLIKDDTILQVGFTPYTPREIETRLALLIITQSAPWFASILILLIQKQWWLKKYYWTVCTSIAGAIMVCIKSIQKYARLASYWFLSVALVGLCLHFQNGKTNRVTFIVAALHMQVEVFITSLFLKRSGFEASAIAAIWGLFVYGAALFASDLGVVFMIIAPLGGANDFLMALLLLYAKQWLYAIGALAHVVAALAVFTSISVDFGIVPYSQFTFFALWFNLVFYVAAIFRAYAYRTKHPPKPVALAKVEVDRYQACEDGTLRDGEAFDNPLQTVKLPFDTLIKLVSFAFGGATAISYFLACELYACPL